MEQNINNKSSSYFTEIEELIFDFIENIIIGIEQQVFENFKEKYKEINKSEIDEKMKSQEALYLSNNMMEFYVNQMYKNLVEKTDDCMNESLKVFEEKLKISNFTCLNIISNVIMNSYTKLPRSKLNTENVENYILSVKSITTLMKKFIIFDFRLRYNELLVKSKEMENQDKEDC